MTLPVVTNLGMSLPVFVANAKTQDTLLYTFVEILTPKESLVVSSPPSLFMEEIANAGSGHGGFV